MKTNKSYTKRLKIKKSGKVIARRPGQNHFNAKASRSKQLKKRGTDEFALSTKDKSRFVPYN
ncbi:MAG: hypothetical protein QF858_02090 [Candidatus Pacebacteria bacterium]|jgi:ribosomal protein L35|nr:hypothetical protein [bacterium]MDP6527646.1 hypothetical protein [Candidatus Paceibacterota bacterium]MDP6659438.1 hypothetical protein [Candidatus Paceibacterota bacterium]|tara:strand:+ start:3316 stop:3501 length:186 start_codon:yes stop_codon:yes gene_type:complete